MDYIRIITLEKQTTTLRTNMNNFEYIPYEKTPFDGLQIGIVTIIDKSSQEIKRFKHMQKKDGSSTYFTTASVCVTDANGQKKYMDAFEQDSKSKQELLMTFIRKNVAKELERPDPTAQPSVFGQATTQTKEEDQGVPF